MPAVRNQPTATLAGGRRTAAPAQGTRTMDEQFYEELLEEISDGVYFVNRRRQIQYWNAGAERITGYSSAEVLGRSCAEGILRHVTATGQQLCRHGCPLGAVMKDGVPRTADIYLHHKDGHRVPVHVRGRALREADGRIVGSVEVFTAQMTNPYAASSLTDRRARIDDSLDPVTGLPPRRLGELELQAHMRAVDEQHASLGVLFVDADHFKSVNDSRGHKVGDEVLRMVAQSMANGLRRGDIPIRWGGEEFLALLPGADLAGVRTTAERIRMLVENSWIQKGPDQVRVTVSVGATMAVPAESADDVVDRADRLMYKSKLSGRNRVTTDSGTLDPRAESPILGMAAPWESE
jgi:diguanylate cyclase (GGDEF)-like protein/PAS domain S-box-containing protein